MNGSPLSFMTRTSVSVALSQSSFVPMWSSGIVERFNLYSRPNILKILSMRSINPFTSPSIWSSATKRWASSWEKDLTLKSPVATPLSSFL